MDIIQLKDVTKDYGQDKGNFGVSFTVKKGECMGFLGPNGAGKTTTIRQLLGFVKPDSGIITLNGLDCFAKSAELQKTIGYLPGEIAMMDEMKAVEFIQFIANMKKMTDMSRAYELIEYLELDIKGKIKKMSKGMKQKIGIVIAFMQNPEILILDEPTSGLDPLMQNKFVELIRQEKIKGTTVLMSSHMFEEIEKTCDRVAIIRHGKIVALDEIEKLVAGKTKKFEFVFTTLSEAEHFQQENLRSIIQANTVTVKVSGDIKTIFTSAIQNNVVDINVKTQTLEELFMHFYGEDK